MKASLRKEIEQLIKAERMDCSVREFADRVDWYYISKYQRLSEEFIREFADRVYWHRISDYQRLSEEFIREFADRVDWYYISEYQRLSEEFIREFADRVDWDYISKYQRLSEEFIREFADRVDWYYISDYQRLSEEFIREFADRVNVSLQKDVFKPKSNNRKLKEIKEYAKKHSLVFDGDFLHAFRFHDKRGCGLYNKNTFYEAGKTYTDWHCDMRPEAVNSFGLGIFPKGNTAVKVHYKDWGVAVVNRNDGKARVWAFTVEK